MPPLPRVAEEAAKKAASAALSTMLERDLLAKPLALFTPVIRHYTLPWEAFLDHAFAATFGRTSAGSALSGTVSRSNEKAEADGGRASRVGHPEGESKDAQSLSLLSPQGLSNADKAVLSATYLRSPPGLVRAAAAFDAASSAAEARAEQKRLMFYASELAGTQSTPVAASVATASASLLTSSYSAGTLTSDKTAAEILTSRVHESAIQRREQASIACVVDVNEKRDDTSTACRVDKQRSDRIPRSA